MSEDQNVEYQLRGARPRRTVRQPPYLQDFELQYAGLPRANVLLPQSPPQAQVSDAFKQYDDEREGDVGSPDSLESSRQALEPWYLTTDRWSEKEDRSLPRDEYSLPPDVQSTVHDLEQENRRLRAAQLSMREEITQLIEIQKSMQKMLINQSQSQGSVPVTQPQPKALTLPVPLPRVVNRQSESPVPTPAPRAFPVPAPRRLSTSKNSDPYAAGYAQHAPPLLQSYPNASDPENVAAQISSVVNQGWCSMSSTLGRSATATLRHQLIN
ncbi:hypothetical protein Q8A67_004814 [Cirrhinus molitorella]|uniref:Uncharacterized protein n=1 Tax=Cirrhinus molitorella TaxID=172907 RepID=A0AA88QDG5_9TELE|nr:hypothetical protein Q8A67_004814 [Cirrhinus molitorella]